MICDFFPADIDIDQPVVPKAHSDDDQPLFSIPQRLEFFAPREDFSGGQV
jgi:hypothetical protein